MAQPDYESLADTISANFRTMKTVEAGMAELRAAVILIQVVCVIALSFITALVIKRMVQK